MKHLRFVDKRIYYGRVQGAVRPFGKEKMHEQSYPHPKPSVLPWYAAALVFAVLCAVLPAYKLWALLIALGGAAVMMFSSIVVSGIQLITKEQMTPRPPDHRVGGAGRGLRHGCQQRHPGQRSPGTAADLRRVRHRSGCLCGHPAERAAAQKRSGALILHQSGLQLR